MEGVTEPFPTCYHGNSPIRKDLYLPIIRRGELQTCRMQQFEDEINDSTTKNSMTYKQEELKRLHLCLYDILREIRRVCDLLNIQFVMLGGSAIGVYYWDGIIPFDDDIDIGMKRKDFERFLNEAPQLLADDYFLQWCGSEKHYNLFFAKVRRNDTLFVEENFQYLDIHQGVYIDILPLDNIPDSPRARIIQRKLANIVNDCFVAKEIWRYPWLGKCQVAEPLKTSWLNCLFVRIISVLFSKKVIYYILHYLQTFYNDRPTRYCNTIPYYGDYIATEDFDNLQETIFGNVRVWVPCHLEDYLHRHYPVLKKHLSEEEQKKYKNHRPIKLELPEK